jgi:flagellar motility protein MotE (MotC chaperone)
VKRLWTAISIMAVLNLTALTAFTAHAWNQGWLQPERVQRAIAELRSAREQVAPAPAVTNEVRKPTARAADRIRRNEEAAEKQRIELARREREIKDGWKLLEAQQLVLLRNREALEEKVRQFEANKERAAKEKGDSGLQKELDIIAGITPKAAKELLKLKPDAEVARILLAVDNRKVNKIVKQCKTSEERLWIGRVLEQLHDRDAARAEDPGAGT